MNCKDCKFFEYLGNPETTGLGECKQSPPTVSDYLLKKYNEPGDTWPETIFFATRFPVVSEEYWCGKWEA